ncbi:TIGR03943 family protein, partial [Streptomyces carpinensis]
MRRPLQVTLLVLSGLGLLHASLFTDLFLRYVKEGMRPLLIGSGAVLLVLGVAEAWASQPEPDRPHAHGGPGSHGHDRPSHEAAGPDPARHDGHGH